MKPSELNGSDDLFGDLAQELESAGSDKDVIAALLIDCSGSMNEQTKDGGGALRTRVAGAQAGLEALVAYCKSVPFRRQSTLLGVGVFGQEVTFSPFKRVEDVDLPQLKAWGGTPLGRGLHLSLDALQQQLCDLDDRERRFSVPNLCIVSDGMPNQEPELATAIERIKKLVKAGELNVSMIGIDDEDCAALKSLGIVGKSYVVSEVSWEQVIVEATLPGGGTAGQQDVA